MGLLSYLLCMSHWKAGALSWEDLVCEATWRRDGCECRGERSGAEGAARINSLTRLNREGRANGARLEQPSNPRKGGESQFTGTT